LHFYLPKNYVASVKVNSRKEIATIKSRTTAKFSLVAAVDSSEAGVSLSMTLLGISLYAESAERCKVNVIVAHMHGKDMTNGWILLTASESS
jgi:hypothetical protein